MKTLCVVLAQGNQSRLPHLIAPKQMLPLTACNGTPILYRTLRQLDHFCNRDPDAADRYQDRVEVVTWLPLAQQLLADPKLFGRHYLFGLDVLEDPGNSSLKGLYRYLAKGAKARARHGEWLWPESDFDRIVVLLGDVVYSWACLKMLFRYDTDHNDDDEGIRFVGSSNLTRSDGELWGFHWWRQSAKQFYACLQAAMAKHPPFEETYQPGQLRRIMWEVQEHTTGVYEWNACDRAHPVGDYTMDVDLPQHILDLGPVSELAARDDEKHGVTW